jgi:hypothetical protein
MSNKVITANRLVDGRVVYLDADSNWVQRFADAARFATVEEVDAVLATLSPGKRGSDVVDAYAVDIEIGEGAVAPRSQRETIRTRGPSVRPDLGYQANNA